MQLDSRSVCDFVARKSRALARQNRRRDIGLRYREVFAAYEDYDRPTIRYTSQYDMFTCARKLTRAGLTEQKSSEGTKTTKTYVRKKRCRSRFHGVNHEGWSECQRVSMCTLQKLCVQYILHTYANNGIGYSIYSLVVVTKLRR